MLNKNISIIMISQICSHAVLMSEWATFIHMKLTSIQILLKYLHQVAHSGFISFCSCETEETKFLNKFF